MSIIHLKEEKIVISDPPPGGEPKWVDPLVECKACGKKNIATSRFCGGCGKPVLVLPLSEPTPKTFRERVLNSFSIRAKMGLCWPPNLSIPVEWVKEFFSHPKKLPAFRLTLKTVPRFMILLAIGILALSPILALQSFKIRHHRNMPIEGVSWGDLRSHFSRSLGLTLGEVDRIAESSMKKIPDLSAEVSCRDARMLRKTMNGLGLPDRKVFNFLPSSGSLLSIHLSGNREKNEMQVYGDIPTDHPLYRAWKPLMDIGFNMGVVKTQPFDAILALPYDPIRWEEWNPVFEVLLGAFHIDESSSKEPDEKVGQMSRSDLEGELRKLRDLFHLKKVNLTPRISMNPLPSRMEAFGALSECIELGATGK